MAFVATDRVETAWRAQARRTADAPRQATPTRSRFDEVLPKPEIPKPQAPNPRDRAASPDRKAAAHAPAPSTSAREAGSKDRTPASQPSNDGKQAGSTDRSGTASTERPEAASSDRTEAASKPTRDKGETDDTAKAGDTVTDTADKSDAEEAAAEGVAQPGAADAQSSDTKPTDVKAADTATAGAEASAVGAAPPPIVPLAPPPAPVVPAPPPAGSTATAPTQPEGGMQAAGAVSAASPRGAATPAVPADEPGEADKADKTDAQATGPGDPAKTGTKDFLAALAGSSMTSGRTPDATGTSPLATAPAPSPAAAPSVHGAATAATAPMAPAVPLGQVPMTIGLRSLAGSSEFQIRLDPVELGRIDVKLEIDKAKGTVATHLTVDRPDTLALLQRDAGQLQQALAQAGLDSGAGGVSLSLRGDGGNPATAHGNGQGGQSGNGGDGRPNTPWSGERAETLSDTTAVLRLRGYGGLDIRI
ncbi:MAG: flagellar hook-length control protein FliK [Actinomycetospora chiangmaiensis]|nr:flagellar hook-length control protein FliK [Actinomycetospora chiangmaiensis]